MSIAVAQTAKTAISIVEACTGEPSNHTSRDSVIYIETKQHACMQRINGAKRKPQCMMALKES